MASSSILLKTKIMMSRMRGAQAHTDCTFSGEFRPRLPEWWSWTMRELKNRTCNAQRTRAPQHHAIFTLPQLMKTKACEQNQAPTSNQLPRFWFTCNISLPYLNHEKSTRTLYRQRAGSGWGGVALKICKKLEVWKKASFLSSIQRKKLPLQDYPYGRFYRRVRVHMCCSAACSVTNFFLQTTTATRCNNGRHKQVCLPSYYSDAYRI